MNRPFLFQYWEEPSPGDTPEWLKLCFETVDRNWGHLFHIKRLSPISLEEVGSGLKAFGEKIKCKGTDDKAKHISTKTNFLRCDLIMCYGGFWLDADAIVFSSDFNPESYINKDLVVGSVQGDSGVRHPTGFIGGRHTSPAFVEWHYNIMKHLAENERCVPWATTGYMMLNKIAQDPRFDVSILKQSHFYPIRSEDRAQFGDVELSLDSVVKDDTKAALLYNRGIRKILDGKSRDEILNGNALICKMFRKALGMEEPCQ